MDGSSRNVFKNEPEFPSPATGWLSGCLATRRGPCNTPHNKKDATTLCLCAGAARFEETSQVSHRRTSPVTSACACEVMGGGVSQLLLRCCKYGRRLDEGCLNIKTGANFSGAPRRHRTSGCRDTAAKSCWGRDERRGGRGGGGWEGRAVSHPLGCSGYVLNSRSHMDRTFTLRRVSEVVLPPSWCFLLSKVWSRKAPIIRSGKFPPST